MNNKIKFLRGTSSEYTAVEKDNDTIYFTTDDGKLYVGDKEVSGSDITVDSKLSNTSENPIQNKVITAEIDKKANKDIYGDTTINMGRDPNTTVGDKSIAFGTDVESSGIKSIATGSTTRAIGNHAFAGGIDTIANSNVSFAYGYGLETNKRCAAAFGEYNFSDLNTLFSIGDGLSGEASDRHNAFEITTSGGKLHDKDIATIETTTVTLSTNNWISNKQTVSASIVTSDCVVVISPVPDSQDEYSFCGIKCTSQADGSLSFICSSTPSSNIDVNVVTI